LPLMKARSFIVLVLFFNVSALFAGVDSVAYYYQQAKDINSTEPEKAYRYCDRLISLSVKSKRFDWVIKGYWLQGTMLYYQGKYPEALGSYHKGLAIAEKQRDVKSQAALLNEIATLHRKKSGTAKAKEIFMRALALAKSINDTVQIANTENNLGVVFEEERDFDLALKYYKDSARRKRAIHDTIGLSYSLSNIGTLLGQIGKYDEAVRNINESTEIRIRLKDYRGLAINYTLLGEVDVQRKKYPEARNLFLISLEYAKKTQYLDLIAYIYEQLSGIYKAENNYQQAYLYTIQAEQLKDSLSGVQKSLQIAELDAKYQTEKKEKLLAENNAALANSKLALKQRNYTLLSVSAFFVLCAILAGGWYNRNKYRQHQYRKQMELKQKLADAELKNKIQDERERISRDLHDHIGSQLTLIISGLDILGVKVGQDDSLKATQQIDKLSDQARATMGQLRETIWAMNKGEVTLGMLVKKVQEFVQKANLILEDKKINADIYGAEDVIISPAKSLTLFRVCQEAINNAIKYADFNRMNLSFANSDQELRVVINDDGKGFDKNLISDSGYGLENMAFRVKECGGDFELITAPGSGTRIEMKFLLN